MKIIKTNFTGIIFFLAISPLPVFAQSVECRPSMTDSSFKEFNETLAEMKVVFNKKETGLSHLSLALNDEVLVNEALCTLSEKPSGSINKSYLICSDENGDQMEILVDYENKNITLYSLYFPPEGKIDTQCVERK